MHHFFSMMKKNPLGRLMHDLSRFTFIGHALHGDGPFRPKISYDSDQRAIDSGTTYLIRYPRENNEKFARRNEVAFYESPLQRATSRFISHLSKKPVSREIGPALMLAMSQDIDLKGNNINVFWQDFMVEAKARGSMLLLVDMPAWIGSTAQEQLQDRRAPYWTPIKPESVTNFELNETGKFEFVEFSGTYYGDADPVPCYWRFSAVDWQCIDQKDKNLLAGDEHDLGETPVLIFTESGGFPCYGSFTPIADLAKRLFNLDSELDEILRAQTFSLLTMPVPEGTSQEQLSEAAKTAGETIGTQNLILHSGASPQFIAPPDGPASIYMQRIEKLEQRIRDIGLEVATINERESGIAMQTRFELINAELARFSARVEDLERRAWDISAKWLGISESPSIEWPRDFNVADVDEELGVLSSMQDNAMPAEVIRAQQRKIVSIQFDGMDEEDKSELMQSIDNTASAL
jgi:hypothetical protein